MPTDEQLAEIIVAVGQCFRTFGGGRGGGGFNPVAEALKMQPLQFAAGVDVADVVLFVATALEGGKTRKAGR